MLAMFAVKNYFFHVSAACLAAAVVFLGVSCSSSAPVVIWTDRPEIVSYVEFFNVSQRKAKAVVVYKEKPAVSLPPAKDEQKPDIVIGSFLRNSRLKKNFAALDRLFGRDGIHPDFFYKSLLDYGTLNGRQYLIPVSFNIPAVFFSVQNSNLIPDTFFINSDTIRDIAAQFNAKNNHGIFTKMGFAPSWNVDFLYELAKNHSASFGEKGNLFLWNAEALEKTIAYIQDWSASKNDGTPAEQDFSFKYLYAPGYKQIDSGRCLFSYTTSDILFSLPEEQAESIDFRWFSENGKIFVEDELICLGLYRKSHNSDAASEFIKWFFSEATQKNLLERSVKMKLDTLTFGICNGFSSIRTVNERVFPAYYKTLLGNLPAEDSLEPPSVLPARWESLKERVVLPYLSEASRTDVKASCKSIEERLSIWRKQFN